MDVERPLPGSETSIDTRIASIFAGKPSRAQSRAANSQQKNPKEVLLGEMFSLGISNCTIVDSLPSQPSVLEGQFALCQARLAQSFPGGLRPLDTACYGLLKELYS